MTEEDAFFSPYSDVFISGFEDECQECYHPINAGDEIRSVRKGGHIHERCPGE